MTFKPLRLTIPQPRVVAPQLDDDARWYLTCGICGQAFHQLVMEQVLYHSQPAHEPVRLDG